MADNIYFTAFSKYTTAMMQFVKKVKGRASSTTAF